MSLFDTTSWRRRWDPNAHNLLPASDSRNGAARDGAGFLSVETHGILPTKRAVSGSSSDTTDEIASDHASSTSDVKVNNTTRSPTMASSSPRAGSSTPADNHTSDSNSAQETSSASLLTSSTQGRHGTTTASSTVTTEGQQPTGASSAISSLSSRITDTASTAAITEGQQHTSFTSATSKGELFYSKDLGGTSTELTTSSSTSPVSSGSRSTPAAGNHDSTSPSISATRTFSQGNPVRTTSISGSVETRTKGSPTDTANSSQTSVIVATSSGLSETSTHGLGLSFTIGKSGIGAGATVGFGHPGSTVSITSNAPSSVSSKTDNVFSTTHSDSFITHIPHKSTLPSLPIPEPIRSIASQISSALNPPHNTPHTQSSNETHTSPSQPTQSSNGDGSHQNSPSQASFPPTNRPDRSTHTAPAATSTQSSGSSDGQGKGDSGDGSLTTKSPATSSSTYSSGSGNNNHGNGNGDQGKSNTGAGTPTSTQPLASSTHSFGSGNNSNGNGNGKSKGDDSDGHTSKQPATTSLTQSSGSGNNSEGTGNNQGKGNSGDTTPIATKSGSNGHDSTGAATPFPTFAQATSHPGSEHSQTGVEPTNIIPTTTGKRTTAGFESASITFTSTSGVPLSVPTKLTANPLDRGVSTSNTTSDVLISVTTSSFTTTEKSTFTQSGGQLTTQTSAKVLTTVITSTFSPQQTSTGTSATNRGTMIGGIVGGIVILILLVIASCFFCRRRKYRNRSINFVPYLNLDGDKPPRASIAHDAEAPQSPIFDPMAMVAPSSHATTPDQRSAVTRTPIPFHDLLNDQNVTIKRTASFSRLSRNSYPRSSFSSQFTGAKSSRYSSSSSSSFITASDGDSVASTVKVGELIDPFADPDPRAEDPFVDSFGLQKANIFIAKAYRIPPPPPSRLQPTKPTITDESTRLSQTSVGSSHCGVAM